MSRTPVRLLALLFTFALVAAACGDSDDSSEADAGDDQSTTTEAAADDATTTSAAEGAATTEAAGDESDDEPGGAADAGSIEDLEALWADERQAIVDEIVANGYGVDEENMLVGPAGFEIDLSQCPADWDDTTGLTDDSVRVGASGPFSGNLAAYGDIPIGMGAYFDYINETGGVGGRTIDWITKDDAYVASQTIEQVDELIQSENVFAMWTMGSPNTLAVYDTLNEQCIPQPFVATGHPAWGDPVNHPWTTGLQLSYATEARLWGTWIEENLADQAPVKVAGLVIDNDFGAAYEDGFKAFADQSDVIGEFVAIRHDPAAPTVTNEITTIAGEEPDVFISMTAGNPCLLALQDAGRAGLLDSVDAAFNPSVCKGIEAFMTPAGDAADGVLIVGGGVKVLTDPQFQDEAYIAWANEELTARNLDPAVDLQSTGFGMFAWPYAQALQIADALPGGLSRTNLMLAVRSMQMSYPVSLAGINFGVDGDEDAYFIEGSEFARFNAAEQSWVQEGEVIDLNGQSGLCAWDIENNTCAAE